MNAYTIEVNREDGTTFTDCVVAPNETEAKRSFRQTSRRREDLKGTYTIAGVELLRENVPATKAQEREAVEKIRAILEDLGPDSYVATALHGCMEDAERNIEEDTAYSMADRLESAARRIEELEAQADKLRKAYDTAKRNQEDARMACEEEMARLRAELTATRKMVLSVDDLIDVLTKVESYVTEMEKLKEDAAVRIVEFAEDTETSGFINAVKEHRTALCAVEYWTALAERIREARRVKEGVQ